MGMDRKKKKFKGIVFSLLLVIGMEGTTGYASQNGVQAEVQSEQTTTGTEQEPTQEVIKPTELDLGDYQNEMVVGDKQLLSITVLPTNTTDSTVTYQSSNQKVATISGMGRITAILEGTTQITITCGSIQNGFLLTVKKTNDIEVTDIEIGNYEPEMEVGKTQTVSVSVLPANATNQTITYCSSDSKIATVLSSGEVKAVSTGSVIITANAGSISKKIEITVKEVAGAKEIDLGDYQDTMAIGEKQLLSATVLPTEVANQTLDYQSSNEEVATVNEMGRITALSVGKTKITVKCGEVKNSFQLTVKKTNDIAVTDIEIGNYEEEMIVDKTQSISATVKPSNATDTTLFYSSSDTSIATVLSTGEVKAIAKGAVTITVKAGDITKSVPITVKVATTRIEVNNNYVVLKPEQEFLLQSSALPSDAIQAMTYEAVDKKIATITSSGMIQAKSIGTTSVIVSNGDLSTAVTIIVNESGTADQATIEKASKQAVTTKVEQLSGEESELIEKIKDENSLSEIEIKGDSNPILGKNSLKALYESGKTLHIVYDDYTLIIKGTDINNYENQLNTKILFEKEKDGTSFLFNEGNNLPGLVTLKLGEEGYQYLYLLNETKGKYQKLKTNDLSTLQLDVTGKYLLTTDKLNDISVSIVVIIIVAVIIIGLLITYVVVKKRYWFW